MRARVFHEAAATIACTNCEVLHVPHMRQVWGDLNQALGFCIGHQANATSTYAAGPALSLFEKWIEIGLCARDANARQHGTIGPELYAVAACIASTANA